MQNLMDESLRIEHLLKRKSGLFTRRSALWIVLLAVMAVAAWWVFRSVPLYEIWETLRRLSPVYILALIGLNALIFILFGARWWLILRTQGHKVPYFKLVGYRLAGFSISYFTPGTQFGGEPLQAYLVQDRHSVSGEDSVAAVTLDKLFEILANFSFLSMGIAMTVSFGVIPILADARIVFWLIAILVLPILYLLILRYGFRPLSRMAGKLPERWTSRPIVGKAVKLVDGSEAQIGILAREQPALFFWIALLSAFVWILLLGEYWLTLRILGAQASLLQALAALTAARLAFLTPIPGALGVLEASQVAAMEAMGFNPAIGISATILIRARDLTLGLVGLWWGAMLLRNKSVIWQSARSVD